MIMVWVKASDVDNASHPHRLGVTRVRPLVKRSLWCVDSRILKNTSIKGVSSEIWQFEWGAIPGHRLGTNGMGVVSETAKV
jgi:hypothetical protein